PRERGEVLARGEARGALGRDRAAAAQVPAPVRTPARVLRRRPRLRAVRVRGRAGVPEVRRAVVALARGEGRRGEGRSGEWQPMTTVCCFGGYDPGYPRNRIVRSGLAAAGFDVVEARATAKRAWSRWPALASAWARVAKRTDVVLVPEFRHKDVPLARAVKGTRPLVFDPLVSRWDRAIDRWAFRAADRLLCDTWAHGELFVALGAERSRLRRVLVGAEPAFFQVPPPPEQGPVRLT